MNKTAKSPDWMAYFTTTIDSLKGSRTNWKRRIIKAIKHADSMTKTV